MSDSPIKNLQQHLEALIFASDKPVKLVDLKESLEKLHACELDEDVLKSVIADIDQRFQAEEFAFSLIKSGGGYQFLTKPPYHESVAALLHQHSRRKLTGAALETLAIIAYKQPVTKSEIEKIRGVNSDYTVNKLMEKELVEILGRSEDVGKPLLYGTSPFFMDYFGINTLEELPKVKEFTDTENQIGNRPDINQPSEN